MSFFTPVAEAAPPKTYELLAPGYYVFKLVDLKQVDKTFGNDRVQQLEWDFTLAPIDNPTGWLRKGDGNQRIFRQWTPIKEGVMLRIGGLAYEWVCALLGRRLQERETPDLEDIIDQKMVAELIHLPNQRDKTKMNEKIRLGSAQVYTKKRRVVVEDDEDEDDE